MLDAKLFGILAQDHLMFDPSLIKKFAYDISNIIYDSKESTDVSTLSINPIELDNKIEIKQKDGSMLFSISFLDIVSVNLTSEGGFRKKENILQIKTSNSKTLKVTILDKNIEEMMNQINKHLEIQTKFSKQYPQIIIIRTEPKLIYWNPFTPRLIEGEEILWSNTKMEGTLNKHLKLLSVLTNLRAFEYLFENHAFVAAILSDVDDVVVMNQQSINQSNRIGSFSGKGVSGTFVGTSSGSSFGTSHTVGDVVFMTEGMSSVNFTQVSDPHGIASLAKVSSKSIKDMEKEYFAKQEQKPSSTMTQDGKVIREIICPKCKNSIPNDSDFCNHCGTKIQGICPKCGHDNPKDSAFCNKCGFVMK